MLDEKDIFDDSSDCGYICHECGAVMEFIGDVLVCPDCGHSTDVDDYCEEEDDYDDIYHKYEIPDSNWTSDDEFPEEFPGEPERYEDIYKD